ncbi:pyrophosphatase PpaX [Pelagirhabdus alkalitolerans]|uniref:Pyrophosphatase PpaX n=1 Tax=Pelagirhabdus alkalitolerans TaxID=1612202 RepID=A0A1G6MUC8_9BACI|nr:pyrophosphatase PpaX [Pelagirhabdus alkalitolerans]SDC59163.1 pyrophosphatase PpaX [Pelagirhabdus alkalitolerans]
MDINTILFDLDGTLIDTNALIIASFTHTLEKHTGVLYKEEDILPFIGPPLIETLTKVDPTQANEMMATYREHNLSNHDAYVKPYPTVVETIKTLSDEGYHLGIVTTKITETAKRGLELTGLLPYFDVVVGLDEVEHAKPHPEPINKALDGLNQTPVSTIMVGDNYHDIEAGQNAGTKTAGVAWSIKGEETLANLKPDYMLKEMSDLLAIVRG